MEQIVAEVQSVALMLGLLGKTNLETVWAYNYSGGGIFNNGFDGVNIDLYQGAYLSTANNTNNQGYEKYAYGKSGCAWFASSRVNDLTGKNSEYIINSGKTWYNTRYSACGFRRGTQLSKTEKALLCLDSHVAVVEKVYDDGSVLISEGGIGTAPPSGIASGDVQDMTGNDYCVLIRWKSLDEYLKWGKKTDFLGYVYLGVGFGDTSAPDADAPQEDTVPVQEDLFTYEKVEGNAIRITGMKKAKATVVIPETIDGRMVTEIAEKAFRNNRMRSVSIPKTVTEIGSRAFESCKFLKQVVLPEKLAELGTYAFKNCISLKTAVLDKGRKTIPTGLFQGCVNLQNIGMYSRVKIIQNYAFAGCTSLKKITIPASMVYVQEEAFQKTSLSKVDFMGSNIEWRANVLGSENFPAQTVVCRVKAPEMPTELTMEVSEDKNTSTIRWKAVANASGYALRFSEKEDMEDAEIQLTTRQMKKFLTSELPKGRYMQVCSIRVDSSGNRLYSAWSETVCRP